MALLTVFLFFLAFRSWYYSPIPVFIETTKDERNYKKARGQRSNGLLQRVSRNDSKSEQDGNRCV